MGGCQVPEEQRGEPAYAEGASVRGEDNIMELDSG